MGPTARRQPTAQEFMDALYDDEDGDLAEIEAIAAARSGLKWCQKDPCNVCDAGRSQCCPHCPHQDAE